MESPARSNSVQSGCGEGPRQVSFFLARILLLGRVWSVAYGFGCRLEEALGCSFVDSAPNDRDDCCDNRSDDSNLSNNLALTMASIFETSRTGMSATSPIVLETDRKTEPGICKYSNIIPKPTLNTPFSHPLF